VGLLDAFGRGHEIQDLAVRPHERIATMRLLICIAQAALDGPVDYEAWKTCCPSIAPATFDYLTRWCNAFELFGDAQRFSQVPKLKKAGNGTSTEEGNESSKLDVALATGNAATLFDNAGGATRTFTPSELALMLTTFQCFSPGGRIGIAQWGGKDTPGTGASEHAPCVAGSMLHALLRGHSLLATVHKNMMNKEQAERFLGPDRWGRPSWELMPQGLEDGEAICNATTTYLGRLVPLSRAIHLADEGQSIILANGLEYPSFSEGWRESSSTLVTRTFKGQPTRVVLPTSVEKAVWRELHALLVKSVGQNPGGPAALQNVTQDQEAFDLWVGGLVAKQAKLVDTNESVFHVPAAMLNTTSQRVYEAGVQLANRAELRLRRAVSVYHGALGDDLDRPEAKNRRQQIQNNTTTRFWTDAELAVPHLLEIASTPGTLGLNNEWHKTAWGRAIWSTARAAYEGACPHQTPRHMKAYALGLKTLFSAPSSAHEDGTDKEAEA
jgi:CRISPR system Cascade subunit CasA